MTTRLSFIWAARQIRAGRKVRRSTWAPGLYVDRSVHPTWGLFYRYEQDEERVEELMTYASTVTDEVAMDWEIYNE